MSVVWSLSQTTCSEEAHGGRLTASSSHVPWRSLHRIEAPACLRLFVLCRPCCAGHGMHIIHPLLRPQCVSLYLCVVSCGLRAVRGTSVLSTRQHETYVLGRVNNCMHIAHKTLDRNVFYAFVQSTMLHLCCASVLLCADLQRVVVNVAFTVHPMRASSLHLCHMLGSVP